MTARPNPEPREGPIGFVDQLTKAQIRRAIARGVSRETMMRQAAERDQLAEVIDGFFRAAADAALLRKGARQLRRVAHSRANSPQRFRQPRPIVRARSRKSRRAAQPTPSRAGPSSDDPDPDPEGEPPRPIPLLDLTEVGG